MIPVKNNQEIATKTHVIADSTFSPLRRMKYTRNPVSNAYYPGDCGPEAAMTDRCVAGIIKTNKFWFFILGGVVLVASVAAVLFWSTPAAYARIYKDGVLTEVVNIAAVKEPFGLLVDGSDADTVSRGYNYLEVEHGRIRVQSADCPDGICIRQGWVSGGLLPIVCLPNRLVVTFDGGGSGRDVDAVAG